MRPIDETFLTVHPRTLLWWEQRKLCSQCTFLRRPTTSDKSDRGTTKVWHCGFVKRTAKAPGQTCIDMRDIGQACGPTAILFVKRPEL